MSNSKDLVVPALGESITEAIIGKWLVAVGEHVEADEPVVDLETDKITIQLPAPVSGAVKAMNYKEGDTVKVGDIVGLMSEGKANPKKQTQSKSTPPEVVKKAIPTTSTKVVAKENSNVEIPKRDSDGRRLTPSQRRAVREGDLKPLSSGSAMTKGNTSTQNTIQPKEGPKEEVVKMSPLRKRIAERLVQAQHTSASLTTFNEVDMTEIMSLRKTYKEKFIETHGTKLGFMSFAVKACVSSLKDFPGLNAEIRGDSIVYKKHYDLGIAVGTKKGLVVPVVRECHRRSFASIEQEIIDLATKAKNNKLTLDNLTGGTFSITNGGIYGSMMSTPLLNFPQTGILGMHNIIKRPMAVGDTIELRPMMYLALTYDHRVVDGKEAVMFLVGVKERMENPERLLFDV